MREQRQRMWLQWRRIEKRIRAKDELYDVSMLRGYGCKNDGYGELLPSFSKQLAEVLNLTATHKVLDVGSGIGFLCFDLACLSGCSVKGIEIRRDIYLKSVQIAKHVTERMRLDVSFVYGDATGDSFHFKNMDVIVCCNTLWSDENNYRLLQKLCVQMRPGTRVVVLEQLGGQRYHEKSARHQNDILSSCFDLPPQKFHSEPGSVSWTSNSIPFYVYTKKKISRDLKERLERDRWSLLKAPQHRTDPHVVSFRGKKRAVVLEEEDGAEELPEMEMPEMPARKRMRGENGKSAAPLTRSGKRAKVAAADSEDSSKLEKPKRRRIHRARLTMRKRRVNPNPKVVRSKTRSQVGQKREKREQTKQQQEEEPTTRQTRAQARALLSNSPPPSPTPSADLPKLKTSRARTSNSSVSTSLPLPSKPAKRNFGKPARQRSVATNSITSATSTTVKALTNEAEAAAAKCLDL